MNGLLNTVRKELKDWDKSMAELSIELSDSLQGTDSIGYVVMGTKGQASGSPLRVYYVSEGEYGKN